MKKWFEVLFPAHCRSFLGVNDEGLRGFINENDLVFVDFGQGQYGLFYNDLLRLHRRRSAELSATLYRQKMEQAEAFAGGGASDSQREYDLALGTSGWRADDMDQAIRE